MPSRHWLIARAAAQRGLLPHLSPAAPPPPAQAPRVAVIVPARDEEANLGACLQALAAQDYPADRLSILVIDDHSGDATAAIAGAFAARDPRFALLPSPPLPPHWTGKSHACAIGARAVGPDVAWLCFIDADVRVEPGCISSAMRAALEQRLDLLSVAPRQELRTFAERLIIPCGLVLISFIKDLRQAQARDSDDVTATGQFMLVRREGYDAVGGHAGVREAICEDLELARRVKRSGRAVLLMGGEGLLSTRMYSGWRTLWPGFAKNLVDMLGGPAATLAVALAAVVLAWAAVAVPVIDAALWVQSWSQWRQRCGAGFGSATGPGLGGNGLRRRLRAACRRHVLFPHSFLVRSPVSARLYAGRADRSRQRAPALARPGELERPDLLMNAETPGGDDLPSSERRDDAPRGSTPANCAPSSSRPRRSRSFFTSPG